MFLSEDNNEKPKGGHRLRLEPLFSKPLVFATIPFLDGNPLLPRDLVSGIIPTLDNSTAFESGVEASSKYLKIGSTANMLLYGRTAFNDLTSATGLTIIARFRSFTGARNISLLGDQDPATGNGIRLLYDDVATVTNGLIVNTDNSNSTRSAFDILGASSEDRFHTIALRHKVAATVGEFFVSGLPTTGETVGMTVSAQAGRATRIFGNRSGGSTDLAIQFLYAFEGELTDAEIFEISAKPYSSILEPIPTYQTVPAGAPVGGGFQAAWAARANNLIGGGLYR